MMEWRRNTKSTAAAQFVSLLIVKGTIELTEEEQDAKDFCEELRSLVDVHEVRGCGMQRMGQALMGCGMATLKDSTDNKAKAKLMAMEIVDAWCDVMVED